MRAGLAVDYGLRPVDYVADATVDYVADATVDYVADATVDYVADATVDFPALRARAQEMRGDSNQARGRQAVF